MDNSNQDRVVIDPDVLVGRPVIRGTRLSVSFILGLLAQGWQETEILRNYPAIIREDVLACIEFAQKQVDNDVVYQRGLRHAKIKRMAEKTLKTMHVFAMFAAVVTAFFHCFLVITTALFGGSEADIPFYWLNSWSDNAEVEAFMFGCIVLIVGGFGAIWRPRLCFFAIAAGYLVLTISFAFALIYSAPYMTQPRGSLFVLLAAALFYAVIGFLENDSMRESKNTRNDA